MYVYFQHTLAAWRYVFGVTAVVACSTYIVYQIWGTGEVIHCIVN